MVTAVRGAVWTGEFRSTPFTHAAQDNSAAALLIAGQLWGIAFIFPLTASIQAPPCSTCATIATPAAGIILFAMIFAAAAAVLFRKDYRRQRADAEQQAAVSKVANAIGSDATSPLPALMGSANGAPAPLHLSATS